MYKSHEFVIINIKPSFTDHQGQEFNDLPNKKKAQFEKIT